MRFWGLGLFIALVFGTLLARAEPPAQTAPAQTTPVNAAPASSAQPPVQIAPSTASETPPAEAPLSPEERKRRADNAEVVRLAESQDRLGSEWTERASDPSEGSLSDFGGALLEMFFVLSLVCLLVYLLLGKLLPRLMRVPQPTAPRGLMKVVDRLALDQRRSILVISVGQDYFLVGASEGGIHLISRLDTEALAPALESASRPSGLGLERWATSLLNRSKET